MSTELWIQDPNGTRKGTIVLAHGAGAPMDSPFMERVSMGLVEQQVRVVRFEFPYMAKRRQTGKMSPPNVMKILEATWHEVIGNLGANDLVIGGKSMGGRVASMVADQQQVAGVVCLGYPFHPPGKPEKRRTKHLETIQTPTLIIQGERDPFGNKTEVGHYRLSAKIDVRWMPDGDHGFTPRKTSGVTVEENMEKCTREILRVVKTLSA